jgi:chemotaxis protein histidine kinase CheA
LSGAGEGDAAAVRARLLELTRKFVLRTGADVAQMREALAMLDAGPGSDNGAALEQIQQLAHRACGTGGTLGLCGLSDAAGALERLMEGLPKVAAPGAAERARIAAGLDAFAEQLARL